MRDFVILVFCDSVQIGFVTFYGDGTTSSHGNVPEQVRTEILILFCRDGMSSGSIFIAGHHYHWHDELEPPDSTLITDPHPPDVNPPNNGLPSPDWWETNKLPSDWWERVQRWHEFKN
jgi:hypothetical protein